MWTYTTLIKCPIVLSINSSSCLLHVDAAGISVFKNPKLYLKKRVCCIGLFLDFFNTTRGWNKEKRKEKRRVWGKSAKSWRRQHLNFLWLAKLGWLFFSFSSPVKHGILQKCKHEKQTKQEEKLFFTFKVDLSCARVIYSRLSLDRFWFIA